MKKNYFKFLCFLLLSTNVFSQLPGDLDISFGNNGKVKINTGEATYNVKTQVLQPDGKLLLAGRIDTGSKEKSFIIRLNVDGSLDTSFNSTGEIIHPYLENINVIKIQPDGKILVGGDFNRAVAFARFNPNGSNDLGFAIDGSYYYNGLPLQVKKSVIDLELQSTGKIVVLANETVNNVQQDVKLLRFNVNGILDSTFGTSGEILFDFNYFDEPKALSIQSDNKIILSGDVRDSNNNDSLFVVRLLVNGAFDTSFNSTGYKIFDIPNSNFVKLDDLVLQQDNKIILSGKFNINSDSLFIIRLNFNGSFDNSFDSDGLVQVSLNVDYRIQSKINVQQDGKILFLCANSNITPSYYNTSDIVLMRFNPSGSLDLTFNSSGFIYISYYNYDDYGVGISLTNDKIIIGGNTDESFYLDKIAVAKINISNGNLDSSFNNSGKYSFKLNHSSDDYIEDSIILQDGKILNVGSVFINNEYIPYLTRFNANGSLDTTFGTNGRIYYFINGFGQLNSIKLDNNGKILLGGINFSNGMILFRANQDGSLDSTFGNGGVANLNIPGYFGGRINDIKSLPNGKIILAGYNQRNNNNDWDFSLIKLNNDGSFDTSFGIDGVSDIGSSTNYESLQSIEVLNDNKIIALAYVSNASGETFVEIIKFNSIGILDPTFNGNGRFYTNKKADFTPYADIEIQNDNKILATFASDFINGNFLLYRLNSNGTLDTTFDQDGFVDTPVEGNDYSSKIYYDPISQKIVLIGNSNNSSVTSNYNYAIVRYNSNGSIDNTFGNSGIVITDFESNQDDYVTSKVITNNGKLIITGGSYDQNTQDIDISMAKYHLDGQLTSSQFENNKGISLFPNPVKDILKINNINFLDFNSNYRILDVIGREISSGRINQNGINVTNLSKGNYTLLINDSISLKFIKN